MISAVENVHHVVQQFHHEIYDYARELQRQSTYMIDTFASIKSTIRIIGTLASDSLTNLTHLGDLDCHIASSCSAAFDEVVRLMNLISGRSFHNVHSLDEIALEASVLAQNLQTERFDLDMSKVLRALDGGEIAPAPSPREVAVPTYRRTLERVFDESVSGEKITRDPLVLLGLEEVRVNMETYGEALRKFVDDTEAEVSHIRSVLARKMDVESVDRLVKKLEGVVSSVGTPGENTTLGSPSMRPSIGRLYAGSARISSNSSLSMVGSAMILGDVREVRPETLKPVKRGMPRVLASALV
jgi:hypothetical protein